MGWKIVRDNDEAACLGLGVSGQWRPAAEPVRGLTRKLFEEAAEFAEHGDPEELYDLMDVIEELVSRVGTAEALAAHARKVAWRGGFTKCIEWSPVPAEPVDPQSEDGWTPDTSQGFPPGAAYEIGRDLVNWEGGSR